MRYGADGYAIYWYCLELIAGDLGESDEITFELKHDAEVIGFNLKIDQMRVEEIMKYMVSINLFGQSNGVISCIKLAKYLDKKNTRNAYIHSIIDKCKTDEDVADKHEDVADKSGQIETNRARLDKIRLDKNKEDKEEFINEKTKENKSKLKAITLSEFLNQCKERNEKALPDDHYIFTNAKKAKIPDDYLYLAWTLFKRQIDPQKKYIDWRKAFSNYVDGNYLKVWGIDKEGSYYLTTVGKQIQKEIA